MKSTILLQKNVQSLRRIAQLSLRALVFAVFYSFPIGICVADTILEVNFNNHPEGQYTKALLNADWKTPSWNDGVDEGRVRIVTNPSPDAKSLQVLYPALGLGPAMGGAQWQARFTKFEELYASYYILFPAAWDGVKGGKLPGLCGAECPTGGDTVTGYNGFSARYMFRPGMKLVIYCYHMGKTGTWGEDFPIDFTFQRGVWYKLTQRILLNTPDKKNGEIQVWVDDKQALFIDTLRFRATDTVKIDKFYFSTFYGGNTPDWAPLTDQYIYFDNFRIYSSANPIAHNPALLKNSVDAIRIVEQYSHEMHVYLPFSKDITCRIFDMQGRPVHASIRKNGYLWIFPVQNLGNGIYILRVSLKHNYVYKRFSVL